MAICLVALGVGAAIAPVSFDPPVRRYALAGLPAGALAAAIAWDGHVTRPEALLLVAAYVTFVATIWALERRPPTLGEIAELAEAQRSRIGHELVLVVAGVAAMAAGAGGLVEAFDGSATSRPPRPGWA